MNNLSHDALVELLQEHFWPHESLEDKHLNYLLFTRFHDRWLGCSEFLLCFVAYWENFYFPRKLPVSCKILEFLTFLYIPFTIKNFYIVICPFYFLHNTYCRLLLILFIPLISLGLFHWFVSRIFNWNFHIFSFLLMVLQDYSWW